MLHICFVTVYIIIDIYFGFVLVLGFCSCFDFITYLVISLCLFALSPLLACLLQ